MPVSVPLSRSHTAVPERSDGAALTTRSQRRRTPALVATRAHGLNSPSQVGGVRTRGPGAAPQVHRLSGVVPPPSHLSLMSTAGAPIADLEQAFLDHLPVIDRVIAAIARRHALTAADVDEFGSWAKARIIDSGYAIFAKFGGRSSMATYLSAVFGHLFLDYRNCVWGRWRPCVAATRLGPVGIRLDELLYRDGYALREALEVLRAAGVAQSERELTRMAAQLPVRQPATEVPLEAVDGTVHVRHETVIADAEPDDSGFDALRDALATLPAEDQVIMRMRFWDDHSVADIARLLQLEQKPLYRRIELIERQLRELITMRGVDKERARELLSSEVVW
jgi:DNA-directed RNA polymerase specialized sigma24 family protein